MSVCIVKLFRVRCFPAFFLYAFYGHTKRNAKSYDYTGIFLGVQEGIAVVLTAIAPSCLFG